MTVKEALDEARMQLKEVYSQGEANEIIDLLLCHVLQTDKLGLRLEQNKVFTNDQISFLNESVNRLINHEPIQYILGAAYFYGLHFKVDGRVLIPRPETEELVLTALQWIGNKTLRILEIGTGTGCIAIALKKNAAQVEIVSLDISEAALSLAKENAALNKVEIDFQNVDFLTSNNWEKLGSFDMIISNPPYILPSESKDMEANVLEHEPALALFVSNNDPQQFYKAILNFAADKKDVKAIFLELNQNFAIETNDIYESAGWLTELQKDMNNNLRILKAFR